MWVAAAASGGEAGGGERVLPEGVVRAEAGRVCAVDRSHELARPGSHQRQRHRLQTPRAQRLSGCGT